MERDGRLATRACPPASRSLTTHPDASRRITTHHDTSRPSRITHHDKRGSPALEGERRGCWGREERSLPYEVLRHPSNFRAIPFPARLLGHRRPKGARGSVPNAVSLYNGLGKSSRAAVD